MGDGSGAGAEKRVPTTREVSSNGGVAEISAGAVLRPLTELRSAFGKSASPGTPAKKRPTLC
jgi:hypothetical protein